MSPARTVLGIGNPGARYAKTRHNVGFRTLDEVVAKAGLAFRKAGPLFMECRVGDGLLLKPLTYVNRSGQVLEHLLERGLELPDLLVLVDDIHLAPGRLRLRERGSDGGHNGLKDLIRAAGSVEFARLRIGVGREGEGDLRDHVLDAFDESEAEVMAGAVDRAARAVEDFLGGETIPALVPRVNRKVKPEASEGPHAEHLE